ncbi:MAG: menaquinone biosynthetic enzyme MqnA/MqnD family protein [Syntrophobacteraceae bacterium]
MGQPSQLQLRLGKIGFLNVLPVYYPMETGIVSHPFNIISGIPAHLNQLMYQGRLDLSVVSSIEYARNPECYFILPDLSISCHGSVKSVLLLSRVPINELGGATILSSSHSHTSVALLKILFSFRFGLEITCKIGDCTEALTQDDRPTAFLAIGDEALRLRNHEMYPYRLDLGEAWRSWKGLPFVFALWVIRREAVEKWNGRLKDAVEALHTAKEWGRRHIDQICSSAARAGPLNYHELQDYYSTLDFNLDLEEQAGLDVFYRYLVRSGEIGYAPRLDIYSPLAYVA